MKKITVLGALATAVLVNGRQVVHAEEVVEENGVSPVAEASTITQSTVTEADVTSAKTELDTVQNAVSSQETVVSTAQSDVATAKEEVTQTQTQLVDASALAEKATPENIASAKDSVKISEATVSTATQTLEAKKEVVTQAEAKVSSQETVVSATQSDVATKTQAVTEAEKDVDTAQAILDGTGQAEIIARAEQTEKQLSATTQALTVAQTDFVTAKQADKNRQTAIKEADQALVQANNTLETKTQVAKATTEQADETAKQLATAKTIFQEAENDKNSINTITLSSEYIAALRDYALNYTEKGAEATAILKALSPALKTSNQFKANANDSQTVYEVNNLPEEFRKELSWFASDLINQIRKAFGTPKTTVTTSSLEFASKVADGYVEDNWSRDNVLSTGHDAKAINRAAKQFGLVTTDAAEEARGAQYYENLKVNFYGLKTVSVAEAKRRVYDSILDFMFSNHEWLHAESIAGLNSKDGEYLGVDFSSSSGISGIHFLTVSPSKLTPTSKFNTTELVNSKTTADIQSRYEVAKNALAQATATNNQAQEAKSKAIEAQTIAQDQATTAQAAFTTAQAAPVLTPKAEIRFIAAERAVKKAEVEHKEAQANLANLKADVKVKQANLVRAKQTLEQKQAILNQAKQVLAKEQGKLAQLQVDLQQSRTNVKTAQEQLSTAQSNLKTAQNYLVSLKEAPARLEQVKARLLHSTTVLKAKEAVLTESQSKLAELKQVEAKAAHRYQTVLTAYQNHLEAQRQEELVKQYESLVRAGKQPVPVVDGGGRVTGYVADMPKEQPSPKAKLPKTGSVSSVLLPLLGYLGLAALVVNRRKENK